MPISFKRIINMFGNAGVLLMACLFLCLTYNSTFPLDRTISRSLGIYGNGSVPITIKDVTQRENNNNFYLNSNGKVKDVNNVLNGDDLRQYEQLVIMKKYPFLDLKEIEMKFSPLSHKNARQSLSFETEKILGNEPGYCEPVADDLINVEIINRGLSGFAIPLQLPKHADTINAKIKNIKTGEIISKPLEKSTEDNVLQSLKQDINAYIETLRAQVF